MSRYVFQLCRDVALSDGERIGMIGASPLEDLRETWPAAAPRPTGQHAPTHRPNRQQRSHLHLRRPWQQNRQHRYEQHPDGLRPAMHQRRHRTDLSSSAVLRSARCSGTAAITGYESREVFGRVTRLAGTCWVMQWMLPPPSRISRAGTPTTSRSGKQPRSSLAASSSWRSSSSGNHDSLAGEVEVDVGGGQAIAGTAGQAAGDRVHAAWPPAR